MTASSQPAIGQASSTAACRGFSMEQAMAWGLTFTSIHVSAGTGRIYRKEKS